MTEYPFERQAMRGEPMPEGLSGADEILYQGLALLYARYQMGGISKENAHAEKLRLIRFHDSIRSDCALWEKHRTMWKELEGAHAAYRQHQTTQAADRCFEILYLGRART